MPRDPSDFLVYHTQLKSLGDLRLDDLLVPEIEFRWAESWRCENFHHNPDTNAEFANEAERATCEICGRPRSQPRSE